MGAAISCVIPTHDRVADLRAAVASALAQPVVAEVVVVDDVGSAPEDLEVDPDAGDVPVRVLHRDPGGGASASRNLGAAEAAGDVLAFLDDDDRWLPGYLEQALELIEGGADLVVTPVVLDLGDGRTLPGRRMAEGLRADDVLAINPGMTGSNAVVRRAAFDAVGGFDPALPVSNDKDLLVRLLDAGARYAVAARPLVRKAEHDGARLVRPSMRRIAALQAYERKWAHRMTPAQRWQLRAKRYRVRRRADPRPLGRAAAAVGLGVALVAGGPVEGVPLRLRAVGAGRRGG